MGVFVSVLASSMVGGLVFVRPKGGARTPQQGGPRTELGTKPPLPKNNIVIQGKPADLAKGLDVVLFYQRDGRDARYALDGIDWVKSRHSKVAEFQAVIVRELVRNDPALVKKAVERLRRKLQTKEGSVSVPVCLDHPTEPMSKSWTMSSRMLSFPCFFLTKDGVIQWVGNDPEELDEAVRAVSTGQYSLQKAIAQERSTNRWRFQVGRDSSELMSFQRIYDSPKTRLKVLDSVQRSKRVSPERIALDRIRTLVELGDPAWEGEAKQLLAGPVGKSELWLNDAEQVLSGERLAKAAAPLRLMYLKRLQTLHPKWQYEVREATAIAWAGDRPKAIAKLKSLASRMAREKAFPPSIEFVYGTRKFLELPVPSAKRA